MLLRMLASLFMYCFVHLFSLDWVVVVVAVVVGADLDVVLLDGETVPQVAPVQRYCHLAPALAIDRGKAFI